MRPAGVNFYENEATGFTAIENGMVSLKFRRQQSSASDVTALSLKRSNAAKKKSHVEMKKVGKTSNLHQTREISLVLVLSGSQA